MSQDVPLSGSQAGLAQLDERSREIFRQIVESYLATGEPVGSRNLSRILPMTLSPASVRNVMADLEQLGLVYAPHTSAGRLPTERGLALLRRCLDADRRPHRERPPGDRGAGRGRRNLQIEERAHRSVRPALRPVARRRRRARGQVEHAAQAYRVRPPRTRARAGRAGRRGRQVENRILALPPGLPPSALSRRRTSSTRTSAAARSPKRAPSSSARRSRQAELDQLTQKIV